MIDERQEELASLYALDLLEGAERAEFERALAGDIALQALVRQLRETSATLARTTPMDRAPEQLKSRVLASISRQAPDNVIRPPSFVLRPLLPWTIAACFALTAAWLGRLYVVANVESEQLRVQFALAEIALKSGDQQLEAERIVARARLAQLDLANFKIAALVALQDNAPEARAVAVWNPATQEGVFMFEKMPGLAADKKWELWVVETGDAAKPVSAGVFDAHGGEATRIQFKPTAAVGAVAKFAVSREKNDGARAHAKPTEVIMLGESR